jgi:hypothetical protein
MKRNFEGQKRGKLPYNEPLSDRQVKGAFMSTISRGIKRNSGKYIHHPSRTTRMQWDEGNQDATKYLKRDECW